MWKADAENRSVWSPVGLHSQSPGNFTWWECLDSALRVEKWRINWLELFFVENVIWSVVLPHKVLDSTYAVELAARACFGPAGPPRKSEVAGPLMLAIRMFFTVSVFTTKVIVLTNSRG